MRRKGVSQLLPLATTLLLATLVPGAARADEIDTLNQAIEDYNGNRLGQAAIGFYKVEETGTVDENRFKAEYYLAQSLHKLGMGFGAFFYYGQIIKSGSGHPYYYKAVEGALVVTEEYQDEVLGPNVLNRAYNEQFARLPADALAKINYYIALLGYRAGRYAEAEQFLAGVPADSSNYAQALYLSGLLTQRSDPEKALKLFNSIEQLDERRYNDLAEVKELANLALGRTLYGMRRYAEAAEHYSRLPRFSRHWDEALFEGSYADLQNDDPGGALGRLHSLESPHLSDEFAPESLNLMAIIYHQRCLWPQAKEALARFDREYVPMRDELNAVLKQNPPLEQYWQLVIGDSSSLPSPVKHHLQKNERISSMLGYIERLEREEAAVRAHGELSRDALGTDLLDLLEKQKGLVVQVAGKFIKGRLADLAHMITVLDGDKLIIRLETTKGEQGFIQNKFDVGERLGEQRIHRPQMPETGHEYWPFDGEYWPDEIGYYKYTVKDACPAKKDK
jgi:tetratricopeptide (TPR) repeat protein